MGGRGGNRDFLHARRNDLVWWKGNYGELGVPLEGIYLSIRNSDFRPQLHGVSDLWRLHVSIEAERTSYTEVFLLYI